MDAVCIISVIQLFYVSICFWSVLRLFSGCMIIVCLFFFFKQKTAYEMRISDWSSDVCSSDLPDGSFPYIHTTGDTLAMMGDTAQPSVKFAQFALAFLGETAKTRAMHTGGPLLPLAKP